MQTSSIGSHAQASDEVSPPFSDPAGKASEWLTPFIPPPFLSGAHAQTLAGNYWRRPRFAAPVDAQSVEVDASDGSRVLCHCHWQPEPVRASRLTILLIHGLEGSSNSRYIRGIAAQAFAAGCNVIRMNMRNCGGTETWSPTLYHSGLSADVNAVLHHFVGLYGLERVAMAGYSMGGNLVLKLAGELAGNAPVWLMAAVGVSPAADLAASADALHEPANRIYEWHFLRNLMGRFRHKAELFPARYSTAGVGPVGSIREFDEKITARYSGFTGADDYYYRSSAARVLAQIAIPTLVIYAHDDPFIRMMPETRDAIVRNPSILLAETEHGGHCAFLADTRVANQVGAEVAAGGELAARRPRHWAESTLVNYLLSTVGHAHGS